MPIYKFQCQSCEHTFETLVMKKDEQVHCPTCESSDLQKLITSHAVGGNIPDTPCGNGACSPAPACMSGGCGI